MIFGSPYSAPKRFGYLSSVQVVTLKHEQSAWHSSFHMSRRSTCPIRPQSRSSFGHEQDSFVVFNCICDDVDDRLALAGSGGP